jgi:hypothetical protein
VRRRLAFALVPLGSAFGLVCAADALAVEPPASNPPALPADVQIDIATTPPEGKVTEGPSPADLDQPPPERPRHKGLVLESTLGVLGFAGQFRHVAPPAYWLHGQLGYEVLPWLMIFGEGELAYTDTSESVGPSDVRAFPIWGFGAGARVTMHATDRVAFFVQGGIGLLTAVVPHDALTVFGFRDAESLALSLGVRAGVEWYQIDRHLALCAQMGLRDAQGFAKQVIVSSDIPLMWDVAAGLRYTF